MRIYQELFKNDPYIRVSPLYNIVSVFDSAQFDRVDQHLLSTDQRNYVINKLIKADHDQKSGQILVHNKNGQFVRFIKNTKTGSSPLAPLEQVYNHNDIFVVAPGSYFLFLLKKYHQFKKDEIHEEIREHIAQHPVNLDQLANFTKYEPYSEFLHEHLPDFKSIQQAAAETTLKHKKPLGKIL